MNIELVSKINRETNEEELRLVQGDEKILLADKYEDFASIYWKANTQASSKEHFNKILQFYKLLKNLSDEKEKPEKNPLENIVVMTPFSPSMTKLNGTYPLSTLEKEWFLKKIYHHLEYDKGKSLFRINEGRYGCIVMEPLVPDPHYTRSDTRIAVLTHKDLSKEITQLWAETSENPLKYDRDVVEKYLKDILTFKK